MLYQQKQYPFYNPVLVRISIGTCDLTVNYVESLDQSCVEFSHSHDCYEVYYCLSGEQHIYINGTIHTLRAGDFSVIRPEIRHNTNYEPNTLKSYLVFVFTPPTSSVSKSKNAHAEGDFFSEILKYFEKNPFYVGSDKFNCSSIISKMESEIQKNYPGQDQMICALYQEYLISIFRNLDHVENNKSISSNRNLAIQITKYMHSNYYKQISLQDIANVFYVSPRHINRVFEEYFGTSFKRSLNIYRLNYAKNYLIDTDYSVEKVALLVGFSSPKMLYQLFRELEDMTVAEYRKLHCRASLPPSDTCSDDCAICT
ncbi:AraC family transcriptional regulator [Anoxybacterium hadale]|uniref:AraC family transcriptional regulator n=1 Tax=Anoxybacterium hadale TaxID=3408580 RepID=UPI003AFFF246